jgi:hypothetical protein
VHSEISRLLVEVVLTSPDTSPLLQKLVSAEALENLFEKIFMPENPTGFRYGMTVVSFMLRSLNPDLRGEDNVPKDSSVSHLPLVVQKVIHYFPQLMRIALTPPGTRMITNQLGKHKNKSFLIYQVKQSKRSALLD